LERIIEDKMKVGAYLIPMLKKDHKITKDKRFKIIKMPLTCYKKVREKEEKSKIISYDGSSYSNQVLNDMRPKRVRAYA